MSASTAFLLGALLGAGSITAVTGSAHVIAHVERLLSARHIATDCAVQGLPVGAVCRPRPACQEHLP